MKRGDLVRELPDEYGTTCEDRIGVILTWVRMGGPEGTVWEVLWSDSVEYWDENSLEVINEAR